MYETLISNLPDEDIKSRLSVCLEIVREFAAKQNGSERNLPGVTQEGGTAPDTPPTPEQWTASPLYQLAGRIAAGDIQPRQALDEIPPGELKDDFLIIIEALEPLIQYDPKAAFYYCWLLYYRIAHMDFPNRSTVGYYLGRISTETLCGMPETIDILEELAEEAGVEIDEKNMSYHFMEIELNSSRGLLLQLSNRFEEALDAYNRAMVRIEGGYNQSRKALCLGSTGEVYVKLYRYEDAVSSFKKAITIMKGLGEWSMVAHYHNKIGNVLLDSGSTVEALAHFNNSYALIKDSGDLLSLSYVIDRVGVAYRHLKQLDKAKELFLEAIKLAREINDFKNIAASLFNLGNVEQESGNLSEALNLYQQALETQAGKDKPFLASCLTNQGAIYIGLNQYELAKKKWEEALAIHREIDNRTQIAVNLMHLARLKKRDGDKDGAVAQVEEALGILRKTGDKRQLANGLNLLGDLYQDKKDVKASESAIRESLEIGRALGDRFHEAYTLSHLADNLYEQGKHPQALELWKRSISLSGGHVSLQRIYVLIRLARYYAIVDQNPKQAVQYLKEAIDIIETIRGRITSTGQRLSFFRDFPNFYDDIVALFMRLGYFAQAFHYCERMKTRTLAEMFIQKESLPDNIPAELESQYISLSKQLKHSLETTEEIDFASQSQISSQMDRVVEEIRKYDPAFNQIDESTVISLDTLKETLSPHSILIEFAVLDSGTVVFITPGKSVVHPPTGGIVPGARAGESLLPVIDTWIAELDTYILTLPQVTSSMLNKLVIHDDNSWLRSTMRFGRDRSNERLYAGLMSLDHALSRVHDDLMAPIIQRLENFTGIEEVVIVPHRTLHLLPLHAAWQGKTDPLTKDPAGRNYFFDRYPVIYAPSASILHLVQKRRLPGDKTFLLVDDPTGDLPVSSSEMKSIREHFSPGQVTQLIGADAVCSSVISQAKDKTYVHFSCHGVYNWLEPLQSGLYLADEPLTLARIFEQFYLDRGGVVVLSGCETGVTGFVEGMDEYIGIAAGFLNSNANTVISSLWAVDAISTALLMNCMYQVHLREKMSLPNALNFAQKWLRDVTCETLAKMANQSLDKGLKRGQNHGTGNIEFPLSKQLADIILEDYGSDPFIQPFAHPYFWAGFIIVCPGTESYLS